MSTQPKWVWALWRAAVTEARCASLGWYLNALHQQGYMPSVRHLLRRKLVYVRHGYVRTNAAGRAELKRWGFTL